MRIFILAFAPIAEKASLRCYSSNTNESKLRIIDLMSFNPIFAQVKKVGYFGIVNTTKYISSYTYRA